MTTLNNKIPQLFQGITLAQQKSARSQPLQKSQEVKQRFKDMFEKIEQQTKAKKPAGADDKQRDSIVSESIERSLFGYFSMNYNKYNSVTGAGKKDSMDIWKNIFSRTKILTDVQRSLLYFNLPFEEIIGPGKYEPELLYYNYDLGTANKNDNKSENHLMQMLEKFDEKRRALADRSRLANIVLMQIPNRPQDAQKNPQAQGGQSIRQDDIQVVGGYASHAWSADEQPPGDATCFLFNLT